MKFYAPSAAQLVGRFLLSAIFILSGLHKISAPGPTIAYITAGGLPFPAIAYAVSVVIELGGGACILLGLQTRLVGLIMAIFCLITGVMFHYHPGDDGQMINYMKNLCMAGGFLQLFAVGGGAFTIDALIRRKTVII